MQRQADLCEFQTSQSYIVTPSQINTLVPNAHRDEVRLELRCALKEACDKYISSPEEVEIIPDFDYQESIQGLGVQLTQHSGFPGVVF